MTPRRERLLITGLSALGVCGVGFGMWRESHPPFVAGLVCVVVAYLLIRRKLKAGLGPKRDRDQP